MARFSIRFMKVLSDDTGHEHTICQRNVEVEAPSLEEARDTAEQRFCVLERVQHWSHYADAIEVEQVAAEQDARPRQRQLSRR